MERSADEKITLFIRKEKLTRRISEISRYRNGKAVSLLPIQYKETPPEIFTSAMIPPGEWITIEHENLSFSGNNSVTWLRRRFDIPEQKPDWQWTLNLRFVNETTGEEPEPVEGAVWIDGTVFQGIDKFHPDVWLAGLESNQEHELTARVNYRSFHKNRRIAKLEMLHVHESSFRLSVRLQCILETINISDPDDPATFELLNLIEETIEKIPFTDPGSDDYYEAVSKAEKEFVFPGNWKKNLSFVRAFGQSHIDVVWLWPLEETRRKSVQTHATVCKLMEEYPDYTFLQSQPALYTFVEEQEPELFERIKNYVKQQRWFPEGATWVESDCNIPSGESLVRQFIYGKKYMWDNFRYNPEILWLPDTFGFNANLPQIMRGCGVPYFSTSKISWSAFSRFPYDAFRWKGIDGSEVLAMFLTVHHRPTDNASTYNAWLTPAEMKLGWTSFAQKNVFDEILLAYGYGDGGGGPTREMIEKLPILNDTPGLPKLISGSPVNTYKKMDKISDRLPEWIGELYLQYHRGSLTSRGRIKRLHRKAENELNLLEKVLSIDMVKNSRKITVEEKEQLDKLWKSLLLNEFHDIMAGTCIHEANVETEEQLQWVVDEASNKSAEIINKLSAHEQKEDEKLLFNPHSFPIPIVVESADTDECYLFYQPPVCFMSPCEVPGKGITILPVSICDDNVIENEFYRVKINEQGEIESLVDNRNRNAGNLVKSADPANRLMFYEDRPLNWDAWDIEEYYKKHPLETPELLEAGWVEKNKTSAVFRTRKKFRDSIINQDVVFYAETPRIDFKTVIEWKNKNVLVKADFPFNINTNEAVFEIPFGYIRRPAHKNEVPDRAKFEVSNHRWAAMFETGRGGAVLNNGKYGCSVDDSTVSLTLLKSSTYPDPDAEEGIHEFTYSLYPCVSSAPDAELLREAHLLNLPVVVTGKTGKNSVIQQLALPAFYAESVDDHVILDTIKPAEDGNGIIIRMYESLNQRGSARIIIPENISKANHVNLIEENSGEIVIRTFVDQEDKETKKQGIELFFKPFEIKSVRLVYQVNKDKYEL
jgi:alpha-mannosidase